MLSFFELVDFGCFHDSYKMTEKSNEIQLAEVIANADNDLYAKENDSENGDDSASSSRSHSIGSEVAQFDDNSTNRIEMEIL